MSSRHRVSNLKLEQFRRLLYVLFDIILFIYFFRKCMCILYENCFHSKEFQLVYLKSYVFSIYFIRECINIGVYAITGKRDNC